MSRALTSRPTRATAAASRKWWVLVAMTGSLSMILLDQTVVSVALPTMQRELGLTESGIQWVVNAYLLAIAALVAVAGRLSDIVNRVHVFLTGVVVFAVASALVGLADGETWVIVARAFQGAGAALMIPPSAAMVIDAFELEERGKAMGIYAGGSLIFLSLGPLVGGLFTEWTWRAVFWINVPLAIATIALTLAARPDGRVARGQRLDWPGIATLVPSLVMVVLGLMQATVWGWRSPLTWGLIAGGAALFALFVLAEPRMRQPLVELRLFRERNFVGDNVVLFCIQFVLVGLTVFGALYVQDILAFSPTEAGLSLLALTIPLLVVAPLSGRIYDRLGPRLPVATGCILVSAGLFWDGALLGSRSYLWLLPGYVLLGVGIGLVTSPSDTDALNAAPFRFRGQASGVVQAVSQVGGTVGLAIMGTIVLTVEHARVDSAVAAAGIRPSEAAALAEALATDPHGAAAASTLPPAETAHLVRTVENAEIAGIGWAYYAAGIVMAIAAVAALAILRHVRYGAEQASAAAGV